MTRESALWCASSAMLDAVAPVANAAQDAAARAVTAGGSTEDRDFTRTVSDRLEAEHERILVAMSRFAPDETQQPPQGRHDKPQAARRRA